MATIPSYKVIPGTDHYSGLSETWSAGPVYCSEVTARLVVHLTGVDQRLVRPLPVGQPMQVIPTVRVGGDDGDRNRAAMLRHFSGLLDGTAGKARFLAAMISRAGSSGGGGSSSSGGGGAVGLAPAREAAAAAAASAAGAAASAGSLPPPLPSKSELDCAAGCVVAAYHLCPCFELLVPALLEAGPQELEHSLAPPYLPTQADKNACPTLGFVLHVTLLSRLGPYDVLIRPYRLDSPPAHWQRLPSWAVVLSRSLPQICLAMSCGTLIPIPKGPWPLVQHMWCMAQ
ncbi:hypothetical protein GPECTOR_25g338 [Gonium pectorale]|uniref:Uncharacterized protein n=1 Tax=Gonium pectorale TaxID=33097 RepID=A0A150GG14_GONPE|nr:hypothetical protein GPECTOR_25g338 [Gonium pectorale]|eukprot:KXZ48754.1 hypothetical protein GPECTOR_25g338 [Gonium pectorale]